MSATSLQKVVILVGVPGAGKSWVSSQLQNRFTVLEQDDYIAQPPSFYIRAIREAAQGRKPVLANTPFGLQSLEDGLRNYGIMPLPIFIVASERDLVERLAKRPKPTDESRIKGHLTRQATYHERAVARDAFIGESSRALEYLRRLAV